MGLAPLPVYKKSGPATNHLAATKFNRPAQQEKQNNYFWYSSSRHLPNRKSGEIFGSANKKAGRPYQVKDRPARPECNYFWKSYNWHPSNRKARQKVSFFIGFSVKIGSRSLHVGQFFLGLFTSRQVAAFLHRSLT